MEDDKKSSGDKKPSKWQAVRKLLSIGLSNPIVVDDIYYLIGKQLAQWSLEDITTNNKYGVNMGSFNMIIEMVPIYGHGNCCLFCFIHLHQL